MRDNKIGTRRLASMTAQLAVDLVLAAPPLRALYIHLLADSVTSAATDLSEASLAEQGLPDGFEDDAFIGRSDQ